MDITNKVTREPVLSVEAIEKRTDSFIHDISFGELVRNKKELDKYFEDNLLPNFKLIDNELYVKSLEVFSNNVNSVANRKYARRMLFTDYNGNIINDGNIDNFDEESRFIKVPDYGYAISLMLLSPFSAMNYEVNYIVDVNKVNIFKIFDTIEDKDNSATVKLSIISNEYPDMPYDVSLNISKQLGDSRLILSKFGSIAKGNGIL